MKFSAESSNYEVNNQTNQLDNFIAAGVDVILLNAADSQGIAPAVMRAKAAGIVVIAIDVGAESGGEGEGDLRREVFVDDATDATDGNDQAGRRAHETLDDGVSEQRPS